MHPINEIKWTAPLKMIEQTHKHPGNSNIKVSSTRSNIVQVYNNNKWENMHVDDVLREALDSVTRDLRHIIKEKDLNRTLYTVNRLLKVICIGSSGDYISKNRAKFLDMLRQMTMIIQEDLIHI